MIRSRSRSLLIAGPLLAVALLTGCSKDKSTNPNAPPLELNSPELLQTSVYEHRFQAVGTFAYHCRFHDFMHGTVTVSDAAPAGDTLVAVSIQSSQFSPSFVTIHTGGRVVWTNNDLSKHTVTSD